MREKKQINNIEVKIDVIALSKTNRSNEMTTKVIYILKHRK